MSDIIFIQPTVPSYRYPFFQGLYEELATGLVVYASIGDLGVLTSNKSVPVWQKKLGLQTFFKSVLYWQDGILSVPLKKNDILIINGAPRYLSNIALLIKARRIGVTIIWWGHLWSSTSKPWRANIRMRLMKWADCVLFYTDQEVQEFRAQFPKQHDFPVFSLNNGLDTTVIKQYRLPYDIENRGKRILFIGRLTEKSELRILLEALTHKNCLDVVLDVIGDGEMITDLRDLSETYSISDRVIWHGGLTDEAEIAKIANNCRIFVYPGAVGLSMIHALSYGLPIIVHNDRYTNMPEIAAFSENKNGRSFEKNNATDLAGTISSLISHNDILKKMSKSAIDLTDNTFNTTDMIKRFVNMLVVMRKTSIKTNV